MTNKNSKSSQKSKSFEKLDSSGQSKGKNQTKDKCEPVLADLSLSQKISDKSLFVGDEVTFTLTLKNSGPANATGVKIQDLLPSGFSFINAKASVGNYDSTTGIWDVGSIKSGRNVTLTLKATVLNAADAAAYTNVAEIIAADQKDPDSVVNNGNPKEDDYSSATVCVVKQADLSLSQTISDKSLFVGDEVTFTLTLKNSGPANATGVKIQDLLPSGFSFINAKASVGNYDSTTGIWDVGSIKSGRNVTLTLKATVLNAADAAAYTNVAEIIASAQPDPDSVVNNGNPKEDDYSSATVCVIKQADLSLNQTISNESLLVGDEVSFTLTLNNSGPANATGVKIQDLLPSGFSFLGADASVGTYDSTTGIWNVGSINSGDNVTLTLKATVLNAADAAAYTNVAEIVAADQPDPDSVVNNGDPTEDDYSSIQAPVANLSVEKEFTLVNQQSFSSLKQSVDYNHDGKADQVIALPGDEVTFTITVRNKGFGDATGVQIVDDLRQKLPIGLDFVNFADLDGGTSIDTDNNAQTLEVLFDNIAAGETKTITVNAKVSTENITSINLTGRLGTINPNTGDINPALPEYYETPFNGVFFLNYNVQKSNGDDRVEFGFLNIQNQAEVVAVNGKTLNSGTIAASSRLDISTYKLEGTLNNQQPFRVFSVENFNNPNNTNASFFFNPDPISGSVSVGYPYQNQSEFLQPGQIGIAGFEADWAKSTDPQYLANLAVWNGLGADGNLTTSGEPTTADEQAVINALADFIVDGVYSRDRFNNGSFTFNNGTQIENLIFQAGQYSPGLIDFVNILVTDTGVIFTENNPQINGLALPDAQIESLSTVADSQFSDLQAIFDSFNFSVPTGVNITIQDSNGDGNINTRLQEIGGYKNNWLVSSITIDSNVNHVTFAACGSGANYDFASQNLIVANPNTTFTLQGSEHDSNKIIGTRFNDEIKGGNCADSLSGFDGNDVICGGKGDDLITGGRGDDDLSGGEGKDRFIFGANFGNDTIHDFCRWEDKIDLKQLILTQGTLDSNSDGVVNSCDQLASLNNCNLKLDLTSINGGTITFTGVTSVNITDFIL
ncbi:MULTISPECIES: DUF11 domain-containing protein [unclassified Tolypothrix]|uniref:DUF11 domain-containing protein n=1 Tax=unclassified Tolypothrix TaxID=2649714 RepID=UPI0005EAA59D|nr:MULTISPECIES: DUF11 domain-containing protein [unclassified Tolypothrix]BAY92336.1 hypothetical protein NIES3275_43700 [Microchaete diplosiphon NIES-3275]EKE98417.1 putative outer membrane adhesin-like protein [Tolypothrix sp. PCC 7601]MBE9085774.1 DUF11 domain-containing protein [Tolypothrix sp. LEGE 11397]UYD26305.1 DUF11 domain-containing protein [Tolypothrix sp. PCC 7712]UYD31458.1 DUF11 domain-containing protein [Tolypothrix sp. PCC 7601]